MLVYKCKYMYMYYSCLHVVSTAGYVCIHSSSLFLSPAFLSNSSIPLSHVTKGSLFVFFSRACKYQ